MEKGTRQKRLSGLTERIQELVWTSGKTNLEIIRGISGDSDESKLHNMFYLWMNRGVQPSAYYLAAICKYFNVSADWLLGLSDRRERR
jgi:hypothetical protein